MLYLNFTDLYWALLGFTKLYGSFTEFNWILHSTIPFYLVLPSFT